MLDPSLLDAMVAAVPKLLAWLRQSRDHITQFAMDPLAALRKALPDFDPHMLARIAAIRAASARAQPDMPGVTIDRFDVSVAPHGNAKP